MENVVGRIAGYEWECPKCHAVQFTRHGLASVGERRICLCGEASRVFPCNIPAHPHMTELAENSTQQTQGASG